jgi:hypothetical protein
LLKTGRRWVEPGLFARQITLKTAQERISLGGFVLPKKP